MKTNIMINSVEQFLEYKNFLDAVGCYNYDHIGEPSEFPCVIRGSSYFEPNIDAPYTYCHVFVNKSINKCPTCGTEHYDFDIKYEDWTDFLQDLRDDL